MKRSHYPRTFTGLKDGEETSYENSQQCLVVITSCLCLFSIMEVVGYFVYSQFVSTQSILKKEIYKNYNNLFLVPPLDKHYPREGGESDPRSRTGNTQCPEKQRLDINIRIWENLIVIHNATSEEIEMADLTPATLAETRDSEVKTVVLWIKSLC